MANSTRSSRKTTEENSKCRRSDGGGSDISLSVEASELRRSTRDTSCTKTNTPKKSISQQLDQTDKQVATPPVTRSLAKKVTTPSPLRRSKRCNKQSPSLESTESKAETSSRNLEFNSKKKKVERTEKTLKQSTLGTMDATENVNEECDPRLVKRIRMTARAYKSLFRKQEKKVKVSGGCLPYESLNQKGNDVDVYEERVVEGRADATAMAVCKENLSVTLPSNRQENHVDESAAVNMSRKSGEPEDGVDIRLDENNVQISVQKLKIQGNDAVADVEQLPGCSAFGCKADSSQFMEYWVPAQLSHVQLEMYCSVLLSSSLTLRSSLKSDIFFGALGDILADTRKCCDHPYLLPKDRDNSIENFLKSLEPVQMLDIGIQASGKLDLLVKFLEEMRSRKMRALILFQSISNYGKDPKSSGDILDDMMRQRFGVDSYERVDSGLVRAKVVTALSNFNDKERGRFVFLLEARACRPSLKLSSVDVVIVFTSDLNPANDIRNLQKLILDSESEKIKVLRLYSCFTVEEKVLINAKQTTGTDGRQEEINLLLRWGASYLFDRLKEFHCSNDESSKLIISDPLHANDVMKEFISLLSVVGENNIRNRSIIVRVQQNAGVYSTEFPLVGESKNHLSMEKLPHMFWAELLEGKYPRWRYLCNSAQRNRKRLQNNGGLHVGGQGDNIDQTGRKRIKLAMDNGAHTKLVNDSGVQSFTKREKEEGKTTGGSNKEAARSNPPPPENGASNSMAESDEARKRLNAQRSLLCILQPDVSRLCEVLNLKDDVKQKADIFLDYVINNHQVDLEPESLLQAFLLALCWTAAFLSEVKVNRKESFELAKDCLSYCCEWDQADYVYKMIRCLKEEFLKKTQSLEAEHCRTQNSNTSQLGVFSHVNGQVTLEDIPLAQDNPSKSDDSDLNKMAEKYIQKIKKNSLKRMEKLLLLQEKERKKIVSTYEEAKANLDTEHLIEAAVVRSLHGEGPTRTDKLNALESEYNRKAEDHKNQMLASLSELERAHIDARKALQLKEASQIKEMRECARTKSLKKPAESIGGRETCFSDNGGPDIIELDGVRASAAPEAAGDPGEAPNEARDPEEAPDAAGAPKEAPNEARAPEEATAAAKVPDGAGAGAPEEAPKEASAPEEALGAVGAPEEAPNEASRVPEEAAASARAPEEAPAAAKAPEEAPGAAGAPEQAPNETRVPEEAAASARAPEEAPAAAKAPEAVVAPHEAPGAPLAVINASENSSNPVMRFRLSSKSNDVSLLVPAVTGLHEHHVGASRLDQDRENVSIGPCPSESIPNGATSSLPGDEIPFNEHRTTSALGIENADRDNLPPQERDVPSEASSLPCREGPPDKESIGRAPDHVLPIDAHSEDVQIDCHLEGTVATHEEAVNVPDGEAATGIGSVDIQAAQDLIDDTSLNDSVLPSLPEEPNNQSNAGSTSSRTHEGNASSIERLNAPAQVSVPLVSSTTNQAQPDQPASNAAQTERILNMQNIVLDLDPPVSGAAQPPSTSGCTSPNFPELRQVAELLEAYRPFAQTVQCAVNTHMTHVPTNSLASGSGSILMQPSFCMPPGKSDPLQLELDKIRRQMDLSNKNFEDKKKQVEMECQKEIAEAIAKIREKFVMKIQQLEAERVSEKNELETNFQKVEMNKAVAAAFRYKCMDGKKPVTHGHVTVRPAASFPDVRSSPRSLNSTASVSRPSSLSNMHHASAASNSQSITPATAVVPPRAPAPAWPSPIGNMLYFSPLRPPVQRTPAPHLQSVSRPSSNGVAPRAVTPPPGYQPQSSSVPLAQFPTPRAVTQTGPSSTVGSRIPQALNPLDRLLLVTPNIPNVAQPSNFQLPPVSITTTTTNTASFSEARPMGDRSNGSAIIDVANIIELSDEE